ncbi:MAG: proline--tRNA ligase [Planctomycetes bacterium]|nr:proline--tRNA ligase [Planctomycetota bacterium]
MRWSQTLIPTLREDPQDADVPSQKLMIRAGLIRKLGAGLFTYLPLGLAALRNAERIVREEMDKAGALEMLMPVLQPADLWKESGRFDGFGDLMCKFTDRNGHINVLGPTHEEVVTHHVRCEINSYRQLPVTLYQIQTKFRDEIRPRFGVIRAREFLMKDAYSFDTDWEGLNKSYQKMYDAYNATFKRAGLRFCIVEADSGLMGGDVSHEFMVLAEIGEDLLLRCDKCLYGANREKAECINEGKKWDLVHAPTYAPVQEVATPGVSTVDAVAKFLRTPAERIVKTLIYKVKGEPVAVLVRGDHEANPAKLAKHFGTAQIELADAATIEKATGGPLGFSGPVGLKIRKVADNTLMNLTNAVTGANKLDTHIVNVNLDRDFTIDAYADLRFAAAGDRCPRCEGTLALSHGIEVGHTFKLGTKYSESLKAEFLNDKGELKPCIMGCYGIGVSRLLAAAIENSHDKDGILWPPGLAPYSVHLVSVNPKDAKVATASAKLYESLNAAGIQVLWDDRDAQAGVKFKDADLLGMPVRLTLGGRGVDAGTVDLKPRNEAAQRPVPLAAVVAEVRSALEKYAATFAK